MRIINLYSFECLRLAENTKYEKISSFKDDWRLSYRLFDLCEYFFEIFHNKIYNDKRKQWWMIYDGLLILVCYFVYD